MSKETVETQCARAVNQAFQNGVRTTNLDGQPALWVTRGLRRLETGKSTRINAVTVRRANETQTSRLPR